MSKPTPNLTQRQQLFIAHYLECWNAAESARRAGYSERTAKQMGTENLAKPIIREEIDRRLADIMPKGEVLTILARQARARMDDFFTIGEETVILRETETIEVMEKRGDATVIKRTEKTEEAIRPAVFLDLRRAQEMGVLDLVKKYSTGPAGEKIELYDSQAAAVQIGKYHGMWVDRQEGRQTNLNYDMSTFSDDELAQIADGVDPGQIVRERKP